MNRSIALLGLSIAALGCSDASSDGKEGSTPEAFLPVPEQTQGFQAAPEPFEVQPGEEVYYCYRIPLEQVGQISKITGRFGVGAHHALISTIEKEYTPGQGPCSASDFGWNVGLQEAMRHNLRFITAAQTPYSEDPRMELALEEGMAFEFKPGTTLLLQLHWLNTSTEPQLAQTAFNFHYAPQEVQTQVNAFFFYHTNFNLPPTQKTEVAARCSFPETNIIAMVSHMHSRGKRFTTHRYQGGLGEQVYEETSWEDPTVRTWPSQAPLRLDAGESLEYRCFFGNPTQAAIGEGDGADEEMCMLVGLYEGGNGTFWGFPGVSYAGNPCVVTP